MGVKVAPSKLHVDPELLRRRCIKGVVAVGDEARLRDSPFVSSKEENVGTRAVHLVRLAWVDRLLLDGFDFERVELLVKNLAQIHHEAFVDLLPEMGTEDLDQGNLECRDLAMHEDAGQVELHLEADVDTSTVDRRAPPERKATVRDLVQAGSLGICQPLELHRLFEPACLFPEQAFPRGEIRSLKKGVLKNALDAAECLNHVGAVVVQVPKLAVVPLMRPPERVVLEQVVLLEVNADAPAFVVGKRVAVLLKERVDTRNTAIPGVFEVLQGKPSVLRHCFLASHGVVGPHALAVQEFTLPGLDVAEEVWNELVLFMRKAGAEVADAHVRLLRETQVGLRNENVTHREHAQAAQLFGCVEDDRWEAARHLRI